MKNILLISVFFIAVFPGYSQEAKTINTEQELRKLSNDWMVATINKNEKTLNKL